MTGRDHHAALREALERDYRIERTLEESASGTTYLAFDRALDRPVLVQALDPALAGEARAAELAREARVLARLSHPSIPSVHRAGIYGDFRVVVLEYPGSETLAARLAEGALVPDELLRLGDQLLDALDAVHAAGLAHSNVTATNIVISGSRYTLVGFGAAGPAPGGGAQDDLEAAGRLIAEAAGGRPPRRLRAVLARAVSSDPAARWQSAAEFRRALLAAGRRRMPRPAIAGAVGVALLAGVAGVGVWWPRALSSPLGPPPRELAILPVQVEGQPLDPLGPQLTQLIHLKLGNMPGLGLTPRRQVDQWWEAQGRDALGVAGPEAARALRAHWIAHGRAERQRDGTLQVWLTLHDSLGAKRSLAPAERELGALGDSIALQIIRIVAPRSDSLYQPAAGLTDVPLAALKAFLRGEAAFARDAHALAQRYYEIALDADSTFALAEWRLANVKHWRRLPYEHDLRTVYQRHAGRLRPRDRALLEALLEPDLHLRFSMLDAVIAGAPADGYARLLQGEELFHRGPLVGRSLDLAVAAMDSAVARDSSLALALDHLVLAHIRFGRKAEAKRALDLRRRVARDAGQNDLDLVPFLELVYDERFQPSRAWIRYHHVAWRRDARQLDGIEQVARTGTPWLDLPRTQLRYCDLLLRAGRATAETHATAHEGKGLALYALGRPGQALAEIDSAAALLDTREARLQQAEWRVIPPVLGLPALDVGPWRRRLEELAADSVVGTRAAWALALASHGAGDTAGARRWTERLGAGSPLHALLEAREAAARGDPARALALSDSVRLAFQVTRPPDAFAGAVFHLWRGDWLAATGQPARADGEWLWYEASDVEGWPQELAQAGEVDAALSVYARLKRARALLVPGATADDTTRACDHLGRIHHHWAEADASMAPLVGEVAVLLRACDR